MYARAFDAGGVMVAALVQLHAALAGRVVQRAVARAAARAMAEAHLLGLLERAAEAVDVADGGGLSAAVG